MYSLRVKKKCLHLHSLNETATRVVRKKGETVFEKLILLKRIMSLGRFEEVGDIN